MITELLLVCSPQLQDPDSMTRSVVEVLHEFAQFMISAAVGERGVSSLTYTVLGRCLKHRGASLSGDRQMSLRATRVGVEWK